MVTSHTWACTWLKGRAYMRHGFGMARDVRNQHSETLEIVVRTLEVVINVSGQKQELVPIVSHQRQGKLKYGFP
jgi:hypothetical protein